MKLKSLFCATFYHFAFVRTTCNTVTLFFPSRRPHAISNHARSSLDHDLQSRPPSITTSNPMRGGPHPCCRHHTHHGPLRPGPPLVYHTKLTLLRPTSTLPPPPHPSRTPVPPPRDDLAKPTPPRPTPFLPCYCARKGSRATLLRSRYLPSSMAGVSSLSVKGLLWGARDTDISIPCQQPTVSPIMTSDFGLWNPRVVRFVVCDAASFCCKGFPCISFSVLHLHKEQMDVATSS